MTTTDVILIAQAVASAAMCGVIWFVQLSHYPSFDLVGDDGREYARTNQHRTALVVVPFMLVEAVTAALIAWSPPPGVPRLAAYAGVALVVGTSLSTALVQMPLHARLARDGHDAATIAALVRSNWLRTILWSLRALLAAWMLRVAA